MDFEYVDCPCCGADRYGLWAEEAGFSVVRCGECALLYVNPRPSSEYIEAAVHDGVHEMGEKRISVRARRVPRKVPYYRKRIQRMFADVISAGRPVQWIDVGGGYGEFVEAALQVLPAGSEIIGIEPMEHKAAHAQARGLPIRNCYLEDGQFEADIISNIDVFSHIPDYSSFLKTFATNLKPGGQVMIETGNLADLKFRNEAPNELGVPDHLVFAGRRQMERYFGMAGFRIVKVHDERFDTVTQMIKNTVKLALGRPSRVGIPYTSPYRQSIFRASLGG
jgi:2-polyprenyl-3-methyl-5-hydroxy-6-metoxy-1,4-benzoquinol methylase